MASPTCFISYFPDSEDHKTWVRNLALMRWLGCLAAALTVCGMLLLSGCGGTSSGTGTSAPAVTTQTEVSGVAATAMAVGNATVSLIDARSISKTTTTSANGSYTITVTGLSAPFLVKVDAGGKTLYSYVDGPGIANINPFSDIIVRSAAGGASIESAHNTIKANIATASSQLKTTLQPILTAYGVSGSEDPRTSPYAVGSATDKIFDDIAVSVSPKGDSVTLTNKKNGSPIYSSTISSSGAFGGTVTAANIPTAVTGSTTPSTGSPTGTGDGSNTLAEPLWSGNAVPSDPLVESGGSATSGGYTYNGVVFSGQCVPAARKYYETTKNLTFPKITSGNNGAYLLWDTVLPDPTYWLRISNDSSTLPSKDDMIVMGPWTGNPYGHVGVVVSVKDPIRRVIEIVDSNWVGSEKGGIHNLTLDSRVLGWYQSRNKVGTCVPTAEIPGDGIDQDCDGKDLPLVALNRCYKNVSSPQNTDWLHTFVGPGQSCDGELDGHGIQVISSPNSGEILNVGAGYAAARLYECRNNSISAARYLPSGHPSLNTAGWSCTALPYYVGTAQSIEDLYGQKVYEGKIPSKTTWLYGPLEDLSAFGGTSAQVFWAWGVH
jgi:hypothetical protein